ncbi:MAG: S8 family serine peptidase [candidate division Zixibacteria bacterium]|nr:S8 family serine peptidase [candidate division Zixibacteria bacterium]
MNAHKNSFIVLSSLMCLFLFASISAQPVEIDNQIVVVTKKNCNPENIWGTGKATVRDSIKGCNTFLIDINSDESGVRAYLDTLAKNPSVDYLEPNYQVELPENFQMSISFPDEGCPPLVKGTSPPDFFGLPAIYDLGTEMAHELTTGEGIIVAIIDNGIDQNHPLFQQSIMLPGKDFIDMDDDPSDEGGDVYGHGTFVTGLVLLNAPDCGIVTVRAFNGNGIGSSFSIARAIRWAANHDADVINMSFGMETDSKLVKNAIKFANNKEVALVAASGNEGLTTRIFPAAYNTVIAVSAIDSLEHLADFSNYGEYIDVCAPGVNLYSSLAGEYNWGTWSGTSFAAPLVSAACALTLSLNEEVTPNRIERHVGLTARRVLSWGEIVPPDSQYGNGCIDIFAAVSQINEPDIILCGDADGNGVVNMGDVQYIVRYVFKSGSQPSSMSAADVNCDFHVNEADATFLLNFLLKGGPQPCCWAR